MWKEPMLETPNEEQVSSSASVSTFSPKSVVSIASTLSKQSSMMVPCQPIGTQGPNTCPTLPSLHAEWNPDFASGMASQNGSPWLNQNRTITWENFDENRLEKKAVTRNDRRQDGSASATDCTESIVSTIACFKTVLRVRVINQGTNLFKDVLIDIRDDSNVFDTAYDNIAVKKANVRKWGKAVTQRVKIGSHEIRCSIWDDDVNSPSHTYTIDDLKKTSTRELYHHVGPETDLIKLVLHCVEKTSTSSPLDLSQETGSNAVSSMKSSISTMSLEETNRSKLHQHEMSLGNQKKMPTRKSCPRFNHPPISSGDNQNGAFRCPFSGVIVDESVLRDFSDRVAAERNRPSTSNRVHQTAPPVDGVSDSDDFDNSTIRTETMLGSSDVYSLSHSVATAESTMRIRITNELSQRHKDVVVNIKPDLFLYESVYDHRGVKSALVRRWKPDVVEGVKKKTREIQCVVLDGKSEGKVCKTYSLEQLKKTSTKDLYDLVAKSDPVHLLLCCVEKQASDPVTPYANDPIKALLDLRKSTAARAAPDRTAAPGVPDKCRSESENSLRGMAKRTPRPNHMNLSGLGNVSFATTVSLGSRTSVYMETASSPSRTKARSDLQHLPEPYFAKSTSSGNEEWNKSSECQQGTSPRERLRKGITKSLARGVGFMNLSLHSTKSSQSVPIMDDKRRESDIQRTASACGMGAPFQGKLSEFKRLYNSKKGIEFQSGDNFMKLAKGTNKPLVPSAGVQNAKFNLSLSSIPKESLPKHRNHRSQDDLKTMRDKPKVSTQTKKPLKESDRISRFLTFGANRKMPPQGSSIQSAPMGFVGSTTPETGSHKKNMKVSDSQASVSSTPSAPPIAEIEVVNGRSRLAPPPPSISLSGELVKEVFPYHVVIDEDFRIMQVGNSLHQLMENRDLIGECISDIFVITGPIPSFGKKWKWTNLDKMKENTIFLEGIEGNSADQKPKIKGSIIELSKSPGKQVLLSLSPNVKNLSELESMHLSMQDLPIHSCQRDAVLLGEHSKSEVKLTNHLDLLHRELIDSMEKQIEDRTNELATANRNLELANQQLARQKAKQLEHFACMSHEIRTPLNCIVGMSSLLLEETEGPSMDPMHADSIRMINTSGDLLKAVVDDVLDYAKLESGSFEVDIKSTRLQDTIDSVIYSISQKVKEKNIRIRAHFTPTVPEYLETDSRRLQQVLFNLLGNAGKFSKKDSVIDLGVSVAKDSDDATGNRDIIRFSIRDYGKGIDEKDFQTIFQPFSQASKETQNIYGGTGLGLSITSKLVHRLGGKISLDSELGKYADFTVDLPMNAKYVDVNKISNSFKDTTIILVEPEQVDRIDVSSSSPFKEEPLALDSAVAETYGLTVLRCNTLDELSGKISKEGDSSQKNFTLLVHETLYHLCSTDKLESILGRSKHAMITYGEKFLVEATKTSHLKTITGLFPATLLQSIAKHVSAQKSPNTNNSLPPPTTCIAPSKPKFQDYKHELKVLYAEDNLVNQKVLSRVLNRYGIKDITMVDNGQKAVDACAATKYDCILLDMQMPIMDGMEACEIIMARNPESIVVFVTAHALDEIKTKAMAAGAKGFITKPFRVGDIDEVLTEIYTEEDC